MYSAPLKYRKNPIKCTSACRNFITSATVDKLAGKVKDTIFENWFKFWRNVFTDYKEMLKDVRTDLKEKPAKTTLLLTGLCFFVVSAKSNPNEANFRANHIQ